MSDHRNNSHNNKSTDNDSLNLEHRDGNWYFPSVDATEYYAMLDLNPPSKNVFKYIWVKRTIQHLSMRKGKPYCNANVQTLLQKMHMSEKDLQRILIFFEEKKIIYRNEWMTRAGKKRHIVLAENAIAYRDTWFNRDCIDSDVLNKFLNFFRLSPPIRHIKTSSFFSKSISTGQNDQNKNYINSNKDAKGQNVRCIDAQDKMSDASLLRKDIYIINNDVISDSAVVVDNSKDSFISKKDLAIQEITKTFSGEQQAIGLAYIEAFWDDLESNPKVKNPKSWAFNAIDKGWAADQLKEREMRKVSNTWKSQGEKPIPLQIHENKIMAQKTYQELSKLRNDDDLKLQIDELYIYLYSNKLDKPKRLAFNDPIFETRLNGLRRDFNELL